MPRQVRIEYEGAVYHVMSRGDRFDYNFTGELNLAEYGLHSDGHGGFDNPENVGSYVYDNAGNRLSVNGVAYTPNSLNQYTLAQGTAVGNGSQHEINSYQGVNYSYLADTRLAGVQSNTGGIYQLGYDALGRTVRRTTNGQTSYFIYDGARSIIEYNAAGSIVANTLYGLGVDEIIARNNNGAEQFLMQDRMGSTVAVTGSKGQLIEQYRYDAFGTPTIRDPDGNPRLDTAINNRILFAGREWVSRFGFYENRARAYHPGLGRFMSEDPMGFGGGDTNLYRYCGNDPVNLSDPFGLDPDPTPSPTPGFWVRLFWGGFNQWIEHGLQKAGYVEPTPNYGNPNLKILVDAAYPPETPRAAPAPPAEMYGPFEPEPVVNFEGHDYDANGTPLSFLLQMESGGGGTTPAWYQPGYVLPQGIRDAISRGDYTRAYGQSAASQENAKLMSFMAFSGNPNRPMVDQPGYNGDYFMNMTDAQYQAWRDAHPGH